MGDKEVRAADERLRSWLRRAGRSQAAASSYGSKNYGATKIPEGDEEDDEAAGYVSRAAADEVGGRGIVGAKG